MTDQAYRLAVVTRSGRVESEHFGYLAVCDAAGQTLAEFGDSDVATYMRSSAKPLQALTCVRLGAAHRFAWTTEELAIVCASHAAERGHQQAVLSILQKAGLSVDQLRCGPHPPLNEEVKREMLLAGEAPTALHNNCSGKHAGMLAACVVAGWPLESYLDAAHPLQQENLATLSRFTNVNDQEIPVGVDGCGVPSFYLSLRAMATSFARLACPEKLEPADRAAAEMVTAAMIQAPWHLAGTSRFNTQFAEWTGRRALSKVGAEGVFCFGLKDQAIGVAVKIADGNARAHAAIVCRIAAEYLPDLDWRAFLATVQPPLRNTRGETVGEVVCCF